MPGPRRATEARRLRLRIVWTVVVLVLVVAGWFVYSRFSETISVWFSGP